jgi:hypothetical protein
MNTGIATIITLSLTLSIPSFAQTTGAGRINGSVYSARRQAMSGAVVIVSSKDGRAQQRARTNAQGSFTFSGLPTGSYVLQACSEEFGPSLSANVELAAGMDAKQDLTTEPGFVRTAEPVCTMEAQAPRETKHYSDATMSIDLQGDINDFFRRIASISGLELDVNPSINRNVIVHLKNVPWDLALDVVLNNSGLSSEIDGNILRITMADPLLGQNRLLVGTVTIEGKITTQGQINAPNADGVMQDWPVEWQNAGELKPDTLKVSDQVVVTGSLTRRNTITPVSIRRLSDGFSWGDSNAFSTAPSDGVMFVSSTSR